MPRPEKSDLKDPAAERGILASIYQYGADNFFDVAVHADDDTFTDTAGKVVWACFKEHFNGGGTTIDYATVLSLSSRLGLDHFISEAEDQKYLRSLGLMQVSREGTKGLLKTAKTLQYGRECVRKHEAAIAAICEMKGDEPFSKVRAMSEGPILDGAEKASGVDANEPRSMGAGTEEYLTFLMDNPRNQVGISTGLPMLDLAIGGGIRENALDLIGARMKVGKSWIASTIAYNIAKQAIPVFQVDTEMPWEEHQARIVARLSSQEVNRIETGQVGENPISRQQVIQGARELAALPYTYQYVGGMSFEEILATVRRWLTRTVGLNENGKALPCVVIYDYLKLMSAEGLDKIAEHQQLGFMSIGLKDLLGRYGGRSLGFVQLNRDGIDREDSGAVADSDKIGRYATSLTYYKKLSQNERLELPENGRKFTHKFVPVFARYGEGLPDEDCIYVQADYKHGRVIEGPLSSRLGEYNGDGGFPTGPIQECEF